MLKSIIKRISKVESAELNFHPNTKCLILCPHADDDAIGCGGLLLKYSKHFDSICISSGGLSYKDEKRSFTAKERSDMRMDEWNKAMDLLHIKKTKIFENYGENKQIFKKIKSRKFFEYFDGFDLKNYDYIFTPYMYDSHPEHAYLTNNILKKALKKYGYKKELKIIFYEVWTPILRPNYFLDISNIVDKKADLIRIYQSQLWYIDYTQRTLALNNYRGVFCKNCQYAEAYKIVGVKKFLSLFSFNL